MKRLLATSALILTLAAGAAQAGEGECKHGLKGMFKEQVEETLAKLPEDKATLFRDTMKGVKEQNKVKWEQLRTLREEKKAIVSAPTFDKDAYLAKTKEIQGIMGEMFTARNAAIADVLSQLTAEERATVVESISHRHHHKHGGDKPEVKE